MSTRSAYRAAALACSLAVLAMSGSALALHERSHGGSHNMKLVGGHPLDGRAIYNGLVHEYPDGRFIALVGFHNGRAVNELNGRMEINGNAFVDVTDPKHPVYLKHLPADALWPGGGGGARSLQACDGDELPGGIPGRVYMHREVSNAQHELWDVTDPANPVPVGNSGNPGVISTNLDGTHKNWWECSTGIAYLTNDLAGWHARAMSIWDLGDPENFDPANDFIRDFGLPESQPGGTGEGRMTTIHEPLYLDGRVYMAYGTRSNGILQILDNEILLTDCDARNGDPCATNPTTEDLLRPQISRLDSPSFWGVHTAVPLLNVEMPQHEPWAAGSPRDFVMSVSEETGQGECSDSFQHMVHFLDITDVEHPYPVSNYYVDIEGPQGVNFCERGGRYGAHSTQWNLDEPNYRGKVAFFAWFNAGVRAVDVRDPYNPKELGWFIPDANENTSWGPRDLPVAVTNNVDVDDRGYIYLWDRARTGMTIVAPTGQLKTVASQG